LDVTKRFSEEQITGFPREAERGPSIGKPIKAGNYKTTGGTEASSRCPPGRSRRIRTGPCQLIQVSERIIEGFHSRSLITVRVQVQGRHERANEPTSQRAKSFEAFVDAERPSSCP
jgi:hypothetical protein